MPYKSEKQRRYLHSQKPDVAAKFDREEKKVARVPKKPKPSRAKLKGQFHAPPSKAASRTFKHMEHEAKCSAKSYRGGVCTKPGSHGGMHKTKAGKLFY